ncbi:ribbon-helix-helix protein, CopG family [Massilia arenosa]|uniref:Ribbon-helix-helix protein, CopG family n=1 Tax=Zemynaea arenosa TaxID=2561931 RepID=A0A4Y9RUF3_9BURK|nr:ribbon-helix-helix protein, CopG family [Massilia arenosa]TFW11426.1 ribbon-helix-helix protein, CopG family [Massilia arenosa]
MFKREYTLKLSRESDDALTSIAERSGMSRSEALNRALMLLMLADEERTRDPRRTLAVVSGRGPTLRVHEVIEGIFNG